MKHLRTKIREITNTVYEILFRGTTEKQIYKHRGDTVKT